jgi:hypothetical protein
VSRQYFRDAPYTDPVLANQTAITATTETILLPAQFIGIPANDIRTGKVYKLDAHGIMSTGASGTLTLTPRWGTTTSGTSLGASQAQTVVINLTNVPWTIQGWIYCRGPLGAAGANTPVVVHGFLQAAGAAGTAGSAIEVMFGSTASVNVDASIAAGFQIGWTLSVAGSCTPMSAILQSLN